MVFFIVTKKHKRRNHPLILSALLTVNDNKTKQAIKIAVIIHEFTLNKENTIPITTKIILIIRYFFILLSFKKFINNTSLLLH